MLLKVWFRCVLHRNTPWQISARQRWSLGVNWHTMYLSAFGGGRTAEKGRNGVQTTFLSQFVAGTHRKPLSAPLEQQERKNARRACNSLSSRGPHHRSSTSPALGVFSHGRPSTPTPPRSNTATVGLTVVPLAARLLAREKQLERLLGELRAAGVGAPHQPAPAPPLLRRHRRRRSPRRGAAGTARAPSRC